MLTQVFSQIPIFEDLSIDQLSLLEPIFSISNCEEGQVIFEQGAVADFLYIVISGKVAIRFNPDDGEPITVSRIHDGGVFGWSAAFGSGKYTSGAVCLTRVCILKVLGDELKELRQNHPETGILILQRFATVVAERLKSSSMHEQVLALLEHGLTSGVKPIGG
jgi:CRP/FNR family transcriptional regulator